MDPQHRTLRRIRIEDAAVAGDMFSLLMGTEVAPRRDFIVGGAAELDPLPDRHLAPPADLPPPVGPVHSQSPSEPTRLVGATHRKARPQFTRAPSIMHAPFLTCA